VDDIPGREIIALSDLGLAGLGSAQGPALLQKLGPGRAVDVANDGFAAFTMASTARRVMSPWTIATRPSRYCIHGLPFGLGDASRPLIDSSATARYR
jgi:hypothetical protein